MPNAPPAPSARVRVEDLPWNASVPGVLGEAMQRNAKQSFVDVVVVGVRPDGSLQVLTTASGFQLVGVVRAALDLVARPRG